MLPSFWEPPTQGAGAGSKITLPTRDILSISEQVDPEQQSTLNVELNNSKGTYNSPGSGALLVMKRGSRVNLHIGYRPSRKDSDETEELSRYFIENWGYGRSQNRASFILSCIDAWGLLDRFKFNKPVEWNIESDTYNVYQLIEKVLQGIGATLSYKSRSSLITSLYPKLEVRAGESGASIISQLLSLVPDVIFFFGLQAYIVHPQDTDSAVYSYNFPGKE